MGAVERKIDPEMSGQPSMDETDLDVLMRKFFQHGPGGDDPARHGPAEASLPRPAPLRRDFDMAEELLDRAGKAFDVLINRCQLLEHDLHEADERARARAAEQDEAVDQWKRLASGLKTQAEAAEQAAAALKTRCDAAEARAAAAERKVAALEQASAQATGHAARAEELSTKLHDKVVAAFGIGSRAHPVLEAVATRSAAE